MAPIATELFCSSETRHELRASLTDLQGSAFVLGHTFQLPHFWLPPTWYLQKSIKSGTRGVRIQSTIIFHLLEPPEKQTIPETTTYSFQQMEVLSLPKNIHWRPKGWGGSPIVGACTSPNQPKSSAQQLRHHEAHGHHRS